MLAVIKIFKIEKFLRDFFYSSISSLNISAFYIKVLYKVVPYKKACILTLYDGLSTYKVMNPYARVHLFHVPDIKNDNS